MVSISDPVKKPVPSVNCQENDKFDYYHNRQRFYEGVDDYYHDIPSRYCRKITREEIRNLIAEIKKGDSLVASGRPPTKKYWQICDLYRVVQKDGEEIMVLKKTNSRGNFIRVVAIEDVFDIILEAHVSCDHGGIMKTMYAVKSRFHIPRVLINIFVISCNVCAKKKKNNDKRSLQYSKIADGQCTLLRFNSTAQVGYINMGRQPDGRFNDILYYVDKATKFLILRPLQSFHNKIDLSEELLHIFTDFGPPMEIETFYSSSLNSSLNVLKAHRVAMNVTVIQVAKDFDNTLNLILKALENWMEENKCFNWSVGCRMLQFQKNTAKVVGTSYTPYKILFGCDSNTVLVNTSTIMEADTDEEVNITVRERDANTEYTNEKHDQVEIIEIDDDDDKECEAQSIK